jgi:GT2 family glycosyltransferase
MKRLVGNCLRYLQEHPLDIPSEIIVVDNDSRDEIRDMMSTQFPSVKFILSDRNLGMGGGNNIGIRAANGNYILILNPDIYIKGDVIKKMYDYLATHRSVGLIAPRLLNPDGSLQETCYRWYKPITPLLRRSSFGQWPAAKKHLDQFLMKDFDHETIGEVNWIQGSCFMVPRTVFDQVGLFDESFFMYFEDTDLCRRIWDHNYKVVYDGTDTAIHLHAKMSGGGLKQLLFNPLTRAHVKSWMKYLRKHHWSKK